MGFFSDLDDQPTESTPVKKGYFPDLEEEPSRTRSVLSALPKGLIKGAKSLLLNLMDRDWETSHYSSR